MADRPSNIWIIDESDFYRFTATTGGQVIYIYDRSASDPDLTIANHPAVVTGGILLPPQEAIERELDGDIVMSDYIYRDYLSRSEAYQYVLIILAAALYNKPVAIMFGRDESNFSFPTTFVNYLYDSYGLVLGMLDILNPVIKEEFLPSILAQLYLAGMITGDYYLMWHPLKYAMDALAIGKLAYEFRPIVKDENEFPEYFHKYAEACQQAGKFLISPLVAL